MQTISYLFFKCIHVSISYTKFFNKFFSKFRNNRLKILLILIKNSAFFLQEIFVHNFRENSLQLFFFILNHSNDTTFKVSKKSARPNHKFNIFSISTFKFFTINFAEKSRTTLKSFSIFFSVSTKSDLSFLILLIASSTSVSTILGTFFSILIFS